MGNNCCRAYDKENNEYDTTQYKAKAHIKAHMVNEQANDNDIDLTVIKETEESIKDDKYFNSNETINKDTAEESPTNNTHSMMNKFIRRNTSSKSLIKLYGCRQAPFTNRSCKNIGKYLNYYTSQVLLLTECKLKVFNKEDAYDYDISKEEIDDMEDETKLIYEPGVVEEGHLYYGGRNKDTFTKQGFGVQLFSNGSKYEGYWKDDKYNCFGRFIDVNGIIKEGNFIDGYLNGKGKEFTYIKQDNYIYFGDFKNSQKHGYGELSNNDSNYKGLFINDKKNGEGSLEKRIDNSKIIYEGLFINDMFTYGKVTTTNGEIYEGSFVDDLLEGEGKSTYTLNNETFEGFFIKGRRNGFGRLKRGEILVFEGQYKDDLPDGYGLVYKEGIPEAIKMKRGIPIK